RLARACPAGPPSPSGQAALRIAADLESTSVLVAFIASPHPCRRHRSLGLAGSRAHHVPHHALQSAPQSIGFHPWPSSNPLQWAATTTWSNMPEPSIETTA